MNTTMMEYPEQRSRNLSLVPRSLGLEFGPHLPSIGYFGVSRSRLKANVTSLPNKGLVLLLGNDEILQFTRREVLRKAGYAVEQIEVRQALSVPLICRPQLTIVCQTIDHETAKALAVTIRSCHPGGALLRFPEDGCALDESAYFDRIFEPGIVTAPVLIGEVERLVAPQTV